MFGKMIKSILFVTVTTLSISSMVNAKPMTKNLTVDQIADGLANGTYSKKDLRDAVVKGLPNVTGFVAYNMFLGGKDSQQVWDLAGRAHKGKNALGTLTMGMLLISDQINMYENEGEQRRRDSRAQGYFLIHDACSNKVEQILRRDPSIKDLCKDAKEQINDERNYK
ncbi:hypothetical protein [Mannheimia indoligenes]|uniref:hypothetical protein n=1 Tax=Mannheimia indoligenes TaxID=3103145 RepID=UPI002FE58677